MDAHQLVEIADPGDPGEARRIAVGLASRLGFDPTETGQLALIVTEAASNILKHAGKGQVLLRADQESADRPGVELIALDRGPGMADVERCRQDGYSTAGSPGTGLGAISRLASSLEIYSQPGQGTVLLAGLLPRGARTSPARGLLAGAVRVAAPGERECGDDWWLHQVNGRALLLVSDGLGHGAEAAKASAAALRVFQANHHLALPDLFDLINRALFATRGAAISIAELDRDAAEVRFAGMGNVAGLLVWPGGSRSMVSQNGTVGGPPRPIRVFSYPWLPGASLIMYTDGLTSHVSLQPYPGLLARPPALAAGVLYRDFWRGRDDATVVVMKERSE